MARILIIDDDRDLRHVVKRILKKDGYDVIEAGGGKEGLKKIMDKRPDLVLLDLMMPEMSGSEVWSQVKTMHDPVPVIVLSVITVPEVSEEFNGIHGYIRKPFDPTEFKERVRKVINGLGHS